MNSLLTLEDNRVGNLVTTLENRGLLIKHEVLYPDCGEPWHFHERTRQWFLPIHGELTIVTKAGARRLTEHRIISVEPRETQRVWNTSTQPSQFYLVADTSVSDQVVLEFDFPTLHNLRWSNDQYEIRSLSTAELHRTLGSSCLSRFDTAESEFPRPERAWADELWPAGFGSFHNGQPCRIISVLDLNRFAYSLTLMITAAKLDTDERTKDTSDLRCLIETLIFDFGFRRIDMLVSEQMSDASDHIAQLESLGFQQVEQTSTNARMSVDGKTFVKKTMPISLKTYSDELAGDFWNLNAEWIETLFVLEEKDRLVLGNPREQIVDVGGEIFFVQLGDRIVATGAMMPMTNGEFELTKMATTTRLQGLGLGELLIEAAIEWSRRRGLSSITLYTQSTLFKAIRLYEKYKFAHVPLIGSQYARADTKMVLQLN